MRVDLEILPHGQGLDLPKYATVSSAGMDLRAAVDKNVEILPGKRALIPTGIAIAVPNGYEAEVRSRSGLAFKNGVMVLNSPGTVDSDYRGEIMAILCNLGDETFVVERGMRIAQLVIQKFEIAEWNVVEKLSDTTRSSGGFGSTGVK